MSSACSHTPCGNLCPLKESVPTKQRCLLRPSVQTYGAQELCKMCPSTCEASAGLCRASLLARHGRRALPDCCEVRSRQVHAHLLSSACGERVVQGGRRRPGRGCAQCGCGGGAAEQRGHGDRQGMRLGCRYAEAVIHRRVHAGLQQACCAWAEMLHRVQGAPRDRPRAHPAHEASCSTSG